MSMSVGLSCFALVAFAFAGQALCPSPCGAQASPEPRAPVSGWPSAGHLKTRLFVVDDDPTTCRFSSSIQAAIDAAADGDVILVKPGVTGTVHVTAKSLTLIGEGFPRVSIYVKDLRAEQAVVLRGFEKSSSTYLVLTNNAGRVWVEDCRFYGEFRCADSAFVGSFRTGCLSYPSGYLGVTRSTAVFQESSLHGASGADAEVDLWCTPHWAEDGSNGLNVYDGSRAALFDCSVSGGDGGDGLYGQFSGWSGPCPSVECLAPGSGADGMRLDQGSQALLLATDLRGGRAGVLLNPGGFCTPVGNAGLPVRGSGALTTLNGQTGRYQASSAVIAGSPVSLEFNGPRGWKCFVSYSFEFAPVYVPEMKGYSVVPVDSPTLSVGKIPAFGPLKVQLPTSNLLDPRADAAVIYTQARFYDPVNGQPVLGTPSVVVLLKENCP